MPVIRAFVNPLVLFRLRNLMAQSVAKTREQLATEFFELDDRFSKLLEGGGPEQATWRPASGAWSVAECIEHVALTNSQYVASIQKVIGDGRARQVSIDQPLTTAGWFSAFFLKSIGPQAKSRCEHLKPLAQLPLIPKGHCETSSIHISKFANYWHHLL